MNREQAIATCKAAGADVIIDMGNTASAASDDIEIMAWLLTVGLINEIQKGQGIKYSGKLVYET